ncbi:MAG: VWA-like domain-containing protein [Nitrososphaeria archaeon]|jgi:predicted metal-dependent peptidase
MSDDAAIMAVRSAVEEARLWAWMRFPFVASILARVRIIAVRGLGTPAAVDGDNLYVDVDEFPRYTTPERRGVLMHEALHLALRDLPRRGSRDSRIWDIVADAVNNEILEEAGVHLPPGAITLSDLDNLDVQPGIFKEELYDLLARAHWNAADGSGDLREDLRGVSAGEDEGKEGSEGKASQGQSGDRKAGGPSARVEVVEVVQEGEPSLARGDEVAWADAVASAAVVQAQMRRAGRAPGWLEREVSAVLRPKVDWRVVLRTALREGYGRTLVQDWRRESRRVPGLPSVRWFSRPRTWVLVDVSGSITQEEYDRFMAEVSAIARGVDGVYVVFWDAAVQGIEVYRRGRPLLTGRGGGGTVVRPALEEVARRMRYGDVVIVLSDFEISDAEDPKTVRLAREVARRAGAAVAATVHLNPPARWGWRTVRVEVGA